MANTRSTQALWLTLSQAQAQYSLGRDLLRTLGDSGEIKCGRTPGGHRRFNRESIEAYLNRGEDKALAIVRSLGL